MRIKRTQNDKKPAQIRARSSYLLFQELYDFLNRKPNVPEILRKFYDILDARRCFGSERNAECAAESFQWVLRDNGEADGARTQSLLH